MFLEGALCELLCLEELLGRRLDLWACLFVLLW